MTADYTMELRFTADRAEYQICECRDGLRHGFDENGNEVGIIWRRPYREDEDLGGYSWPADMRAEFERLTGKPEFNPNWDGSTMINLVEMVEKDQGFNQPCAFGNLCSGHAVYCHNDGWLYSPRKCQRTWYTGGKFRDEDCPGFKPNPRWKENATR